MKIGIDPGNTGAIAFIGDDKRLVRVYDMPLMAHGKKNQINPAALSLIFQQERENAGNIPMMAYVEEVAAMPGQGVTSMFNFGMGYGVIKGVLAAMKIPFVLVKPRAWKARCGLIGKDKDNARTVAQQMYPTAPLGRKKDVGRADAILIARFSGEP